jgi:uncharacterized protein YceH (UPF0502 family)
LQAACLDKSARDYADAALHLLLGQQSINMLSARAHRIAPFVDAEVCTKPATGLHKYSLVKAMFHG